MHRDLVAMNDRTRASDDKLAGTIEAVHASLKQLVQRLRTRRFYAASARTGRARAASGGAQATRSVRRAHA